MNLGEKKNQGRATALGAVLGEMEAPDLGEGISVCGTFCKYPSCFLGCENGKTLRDGKTCSPHDGVRIPPNLPKSVRYSCHQLQWGRKRVVTNSRVFLTHMSEVFGTYTAPKC